MYRLSLVNVKQDESGRSEWNFIDELDMSDQMESTFIPPVTKNVFMKYYTPTASDFTVWNENDFLGYKEDIALVLQEFLKEKE